MMTTKDLAMLVYNMRKAQRTYFRERRQADLQTSKDLEKQVDQAVAAILKPPSPTLPGFGGDR